MIMKLSMIFQETAQDCLNVERAGMISTRETTHADRCASPRESYLPWETEISNIGSSGSLQSSICGTNDDRISCSCNKEVENNDNRQQGCQSYFRLKATNGQNKHGQVTLWKVSIQSKRKWCPFLNSGRKLGSSLTGLLFNPTIKSLSIWGSN